MLCVVARKKIKEKPKEKEETLRGDRDIYYVICGNGFMGVCKCQTHKIAYIKYVQFLKYQLYLNQTVKKRLGKIRK